VLADRSAIIVTHDLLDAVLLSHKIRVIDEGQIVESVPMGKT
jgi:molybdate transport system ATP-binding protein